MRELQVKIRARSRRNYALTTSWRCSNTPLPTACGGGAYFLTLKIGFQVSPGYRYLLLGLDRIRQTFGENINIINYNFNHLIRC